MRDRRHGPDARCACGASITGQNIQAPRCDACRVSARRAARAAYMWRMRRKAGIPQAKQITPLTAQLIAETRVKRGWSYRAIAADFGVGQGTIRKYSLDPSKARTKTARTLAVPRSLSTRVHIPSTRVPTSDLGRTQEGSDARGAARPKRRGVSCENASVPEPQRSAA